MQKHYPYLKEYVPTEITGGVSRRMKSIRTLFRGCLMILIFRQILPSATDLKYWFLTKWNAGVITSIKFVADSPSHIANAYEAVSKFTQEKTEQLTKSE